LQIDQQALGSGYCCETERVFSGNPSTDKSYFTAMGSGVAGVSVEFAQWLLDNAYDNDRVHLHGYPHSPPHWFKTATGRTVGNDAANITAYQGWSACTNNLDGAWCDTGCVSAANGCSSCGCCMKERATPFLDEWCNATPSGESVGGTIKNTYYTKFAHWLAGYSEAFKDAVNRSGHGFDSLSMQNEVSYESPFLSMSWTHCPTPGSPSNSCWDQYADGLKAIKDYWSGKSLPPIVGPGEARLGFNFGEIDWRLWVQKRLIYEVKNQGDATLIDFLDAYQTNHYWQIYNEQNNKVIDNYVNGLRSKPDTGMEAWLNANEAWVSKSELLPAADDKPQYYTEAGNPDVRAWLKNGTSPGEYDGLSTAAAIHTYLTFGNASVFYFWTFSNAAGCGNVICSDQLSNLGAAAKYNAVKHYSRWIRPGAVRIKAIWDSTLDDYPSIANYPGDASRDGSSRWDTAHGLNITAWHHGTDNDLVIVVNNMKSTAKAIALKLNNQSSSGTFSRWQSTNGSYWQSVSAPIYHPAKHTMYFTVPAYSVTTIVDFNTP